MKIKQMVIATRNRGKLAEFEVGLTDLEIECIPVTDFSQEPVAETGLTFVENALLKARAACAVSGLPALADDSGLVVEALNGAPGVYSSRYAGEHADDERNNQKLLEALADVLTEKREACFFAVVVLLRHADDPCPEIFRGCWQGRILTAPQGDKGFGYDPLFYVPTHQCSAAELRIAEKNQVSHRGQSLMSLRSYLQSSANRPL